MTYQETLLLPLSLSPLTLSILAIALSILALILCLIHIAPFDQRDEPPKDTRP